MISVIIPTMNRADALGKTSLPSLLRQNNADFEVIVWDASEGGESAEVCERLREDFAAMGASLRYHKAPRRGSASQRNDAT
ncbi:MAG: glycosyltransferase, partial [Synergistaceae bacterium]|nr:glycosyltransferase [Synergistaceae bacterium]